MRLILFFFILLFSAQSRAQLKEFEHAYDVNLNEEIPMLWRLQKEYAKSRSDYDWHYDYSWNIPPIFDKDFHNSIKQFGTIEKRIESADEEGLLRDLQHLPKEFYPYIGPVLHTVPGLSGKILELPGIKETKNKFPQKVASKLAAIPDIEFVSPGLYIYLMPMIFGEGVNSREFPQTLKKHQNMPPIRIKKELLESALKEVPTEKFALNAPTQPQNIGIRHYSADASTPLSQADVKAFVGTLDNLLKFKSDLQTDVKFISLNGIMSYWDEKNGVNKDAAFLKTMVNPCQTIARKVKWLGMRQEFQKVIGNQAFGLDDWAYTCDKTLKAYRSASQTYAEITSMNILKKGYIYKMINQFDYYTPEERLTHKYFIEASIQLYKTTSNDIDAVKPYKDELYQKLSEFGSNLLGAPLILP